MVDFFRDAVEVSVGTRRSNLGLPPEFITVTVKCDHRVSMPTPGSLGFSMSHSAVGNYTMNELEEMFKIPLEKLPTLIDLPDSKVSNAFYMARLIKGV